MKSIAILLSIFIIMEFANAASTCETYITDEWPDSRYNVEIISGDNVVTDMKTGLIWKQCSEGLSGSGCSNGSVTTHTWKQALDLASGTDFAGYTDWRLANIEELRSISAINCFNPSINETVFPNTPSDLFWSSSPHASVDFDAWILIFDNGLDFSFDRVNPYHVRLVRSGY